MSKDAVGLEGVDGVLDCVSVCDVVEQGDFVLGSVGAKGG